MSGGNSKILSEFQGIRRLAAIGIALLALGFPAAAMATAEHPRDFSFGKRAGLRSSGSDSGLPSFAGTKVGRRSRSGEDGDRSDFGITLNRPRAGAVAFAKNVFAVSLFRHFDAWEKHRGDHQDGPWKVEPPFSDLLRPDFAWHWKKRYRDCNPPIPEPGTGLLLGMGLVALACGRRRG